ncbi:MAG: dodecin family protein [Acidimicrobiia bacterium]
MSDYITKGAVKVIEVIGVSDEGWEDAAAQAVKKASESVKGITGIEVTAHTARVTDGKITQYNATIKLAFVVA